MKKIHFTAIKVLLLKEDVDIEKVLVSNKISSGEKSYKYFIGYLNDDYKVKPLHLMHRKTSSYAKSYDVQTKWMHFLIEDDDLLEKYVIRKILFGIKSALILKKNLIASLSIIKNF